MFGVSDRVRLKNRAAHLQKLARALKFWIQKLEDYTIQEANNKGADQNARMCAGWSPPLLFAYGKTGFLMTAPIIKPVKWWIFFITFFSNRVWCNQRAKRNNSKTSEMHKMKTRYPLKSQFYYLTKGSDSACLWTGCECSVTGALFLKCIGTYEWTYIMSTPPLNSWDTKSCSLTSAEK